MLFLCTAQTLLSQESSNKDPMCIPGTNEYTDRYMELKALYDKAENSESSRSSKLVYKTFVDKIHYNGDRMEFFKQAMRDKTFLNKWVLDNIEKTDFKDVSEAQAEMLKVEEANKRSISENADYYTRLFETMRVCQELALNFLSGMASEQTNLFLSTPRRN